MLSTMKNRSRVWFTVIPILLLILAAVVFLVWGPLSLISPSNGKSIPITGSSLSNNSAEAQLGMSQRAVDAYGSRLTALANASTVGMSRRAIDAYSARLSGAAVVPSGMSERARNAYSARLEGHAKYYQNMGSK